MQPDLPPILVAGAGSWGTALAILLSRNQQLLYLWGHRPEHMAALKRERQNRRYLPGVRFPDELEILEGLGAALRDAGDVLIAVPCRALRGVIEQLIQVPRP